VRSPLLDSAFPVANHRFMTRHAALSTLAAPPILLLAALTGSCSSSSPVKEASQATAAAADAYAKGLVRGIDRGKQDRAASDLANVKRALEQYAADESSFPEAATCSDLLSRLPSRSPLLPEQDPWGNYYECHSSAAGYVIRSPGDDHAPGTADDVVVQGGSPPAP